MPNLLATKWGRFFAFFCLYITEGIPLGFTATAMVTQLRNNGVGPEQIGLFVGALYAPWAWKWAAGPVVDLVYSNRLGQRRGWIVSMQLLMIASLMGCMRFDLATQLPTIMLVLFIHNSFCAVQDVAIDALACGALKSDERGTGNGLMFAGQSIGQAIGGAGVLYLIEYLVGPKSAPRMTEAEAFHLTYYFIGGSLLLVTLLIALPLREQPVKRSTAEGGVIEKIVTELQTYVVVAFKSFFMSRTAFLGLLIAILPGSAAALGLALQNNLAVELGLGNKGIADMALASTVVSAAGCFFGGLASDFFGRRKSLVLFLILTSLPTAWLGYGMQQHGWIMPDPSVTEDGPAAQVEPAGSKEINTVAAPIAPLRQPPAELVKLFWICVVFYSAMYGLMTGSQIPIFMEITNPAVAATQFTAYMALHNLATTYTAVWQGYSIAHWGYPTTLVIDASVGLISITLIPFLILNKNAEPEGL